MSRWFQVIPIWFGAFLAATFSFGAEVRVVSQSVGTDELLLALAEPGQIAALSHLANDPPAT
jgi:iron complex transport system substrate-binding protein